MAGSSGLQKRHIVVALCFLATFICYIDRVSISVAVIPMAEQYGWSNTTKGWVLSSFFIGYLLAMVPGGWLSGAMAAASCWAAGWCCGRCSRWRRRSRRRCRWARSSRSGSAWVWARRQPFPAAMNLFARWLPPGERTRAVTLNLGGISLGTAFGLSVAGVIVAASGWPAIFHIFGVVGLGYAAVWFWLVRDRPAVHPTITAPERALLAACVDGEAATRAPVPWRALAAHPAVWALAINHFCSTWLLYLMLTWLPSYFRDVQHLGIASSGVFAVGPWWRCSPYPTLPRCSPTG